MLRTRVLTAAVLAPLAFALVFLAAPRTFAAVAALLLLIGSWEYRKLADLGSGIAGWALPVIQAGLFLYFMTEPGHWMADARGYLLMACAAWLVMYVQLYFYRPGRKPDRAYRVRSFANALLALTFGWMALTWLRYEPSGEWWLLVLLLIIWAADIGAYFAGRRFGRRKLAPDISPGKTLAGLYGGLILAAVVPVVAVSLVPAIDANLVFMALLGLITAIASAGGDLFISMHKRISGFKDSGRLFPGHGGVLDRFDSLLAGAPFFALGKLLLGL